jgi:hypothetical protein
VLEEVEALDPDLVGVPCGPPVELDRVLLGRAQILPLSGIIRQDRCDRAAAVGPDFLHNPNIGR